MADLRPQSLDLHQPRNAMLAAGLAQRAQILITLR